MIKNTIIVILLLLLLITFYAYICLSTNMTDFQKERMEHILKKENELTQKEQKLQTITECNDNMNKYKNIIAKLSTDLTRTVDDFNQIVKFVNQANNNTNLGTNTNTNMNSVYSSLTNTSTTENPIIFAGTKEYFNQDKIIEHFDNLEDNNELDKPIQDN